MVLREDNVIETVTGDRSPHYEPFGWHHWPEHPWLSYQFRRGLGETQEGGGDTESWHREWQAVADRNFARGEDEAARGHVRTAMNCWLRAADYYRQAEFFLGAADPRRLATFTKMERASHSFLAHLSPPGEVLEIPYEGASLYAYFVSAGTSTERQPCLISMGGLDSIKDEMWFMQARGALQRVYEVPIGRCLDYLMSRRDVDPSRIAVCGSSLGGYYAARAASREPRLAACVSHGAIWSIHEFWKNADERHGLAGYIKWVFGVKTMADAIERSRRSRSTASSRTCGVHTSSCTAATTSSACRRPRESTSTRTRTASTSHCGSSRRRRRAPNTASTTTRPSARNSSAIGWPTCSGSISARSWLACSRDRPRGMPDRSSSPRPCLSAGDPATP